jgi:hypothetical protein
MSGAPLAEAWVAWIAENALRGLAPEALAEALVAQGLAPDDARREVEAVTRSPILAAARKLLTRSAGVEQAARLVRSLATPVVEVDALDEDTLFRAHWTTSRPVTFRGAARGWPAASWTPEALARRCGDVVVDVLDGRTRRWDWWNDRDAITRQAPFGELMRRLATDEGDDWYCDGRTALLRHPGLRGLSDDLGTLPGLVGDGFPSLWVGPKGTLTPMHHDQSTGWLVQLVGTKRVWMASPLEPALLDTTVGLYNRVDARAPRTGDLAEVAFSTVDLAPGDALLIPVGWWHQVEATSASISVSLGGFRWPNHVPWYCPGRS